jgi:O-antigen ligase
MDTDRLQNYIKAYWVAVTFLLFIGFWQLLHLTVGFPMFDMQTRSYVHSVGGGAKLFFDFRLTSFASEPSYMVPFVIDAFLIGALVFSSFKKYIMWSFIPAMFILLFSFSLGGYLNFFLVFCGFLLLIFTTSNPYKGKVLKALAVVVGLVAAAALVKMSFILEFIAPVIGRLDTVFDMQEHERLFLLLMPFLWIFQHGQTLFQVLFGMGPGSFKYLNITQYFPDDLHKVYVTSNNLYIDVLYEHGFIGFILSLILMGYFLWYFFKRRNEGKYAQAGFLITLHLSITSLYRADFTSPRFWMLFIILFILIHLLSIKKQKKI